MPNSRLNNSLISSRTRSRSNSVSSFDSSMEEVFEAPQLPSVSAATVFNSSDIAAAIVKGLQVTGATNNLEYIRNDVKQSYLHILEQGEKQLLLEKEQLQSKEAILNLNANMNTLLERTTGSSSQVEPPILQIGDDTFAPGGSMHNTLSVSCL